jgi:hypothetical protein
VNEQADIPPQRRTPPKPDTIGWKFWQAALKGKKFEVPLAMVPIGYYRTQNRTTGVWYPVAIWIASDGFKHCKTGMSDRTKVILDSAEAEEDYDFKVFSYIGRHPISYEDYQAWMANREWPEHLNLKPIPAAADKPKDPPQARPGVIGDNSGASEEEIEEMTLEALRAQIDAAKPQVKKLAKVTSKEEGDAAQGLRSRLTRLSSEGEKAREAEKEPHLTAGRAVDAAWKPLVNEAAGLAADLKRALEDFTTAEISRVRALEAAAEAERRAAEAREAEATRVAEAAKKAAEAPAVGKPAVAAPAPIVPEPVAPAPIAPPAPTSIIAAPTAFKGAQGRKSSAKVVMVPTIVDQDAVYEQLKKNPEVIELLNALVAKIYRNYGPGMPDMKGVTSVERASLR